MTVCRNDGINAFQCMQVNMNRKCGQILIDDLWSKSAMKCKQTNDQNKNNDEIQYARLKPLYLLVCSGRCLCWNVCWFCDNFGRHSFNHTISDDDTMHLNDKRRSTVVQNCTLFLWLAFIKITVSIYYQDNIFTVKNAKLFALQSKMLFAICFVFEWPMVDAIFEIANCTDKTIVKQTKRKMSEHLSFALFFNINDLIAISFVWMCQNNIVNISIVQNTTNHFWLWRVVDCFNTQT